MLSITRSDGQKSAKRTDTVSEAVSRKSLKKSKVIKLVKEKVSCVYKHVRTNYTFVTLQPTVDFFGRTVKSGRTAGKLLIVHFLSFKVYYYHVSPLGKFPFSSLPTWLYCPTLDSHYYHCVHAHTS